jgi:hypothetical protein
VIFSINLELVNMKAPAGGRSVRLRRCRRAMATGAHSGIYREIADSVRNVLYTDLAIDHSLSA